MSAHTPGPWVIDWYDNYSEETGDTLPPTHAAAIRADGTKESVCGTCDGCHKIAMADAHLIAAAPDLLAAAKNAVDYCCGNPETRASDEPCSSCGPLIAAIAKAEGKS